MFGKEGLRVISKIISEDIEKIIEIVGSSLRRLEGKTLLITGPNGLLASYLVDTVARLNEEVFKKPCEVIGLGRSKIKENDRLGHLLNRKDIIFFQHDASEPINLREPIHFIIHAAGRSAPKTFQEDPIGTIDINVKGLRWLLDLAVKDKIESFLYFSSGEIYGNPLPEYIPTPETYNGNSSSTGLRACYTESKRCGEALCLAFYKIHNVPVKIVRPFIVYGPGLPIEDHRVMAEFMRSGLEKKPIVMADEGMARRNYCYILDAIIFFWKIFLSEESGEVFNVGNNAEEVSIRELAKLIHKICGIKGEIIFRKKENTFLRDSPTRVCPDTSKACRKFSYIPQVKLEEGLKRTLDWNLEEISE